MALTEETVIESVTYLAADASIRVVRSHRFLRDGIVVASNPMSASYANTDAILGEDARVVAIARAAWADATPPRELSKVNFALLFTQPEFAATQAALATSPGLAYFFFFFDQATVVNLSHPITVGAIETMVTLHILTPERAAQILAGQPPPQA